MSFQYAAYSDIKHKNDIADFYICLLWEQSNTQPHTVGPRYFQPPLGPDQWSAQCCGQSSWSDLEVSLSTRNIYKNTCSPQNSVIKLVVRRPDALLDRAVINL